MQCFKCGNTLPDDSAFCQFCGTDLSQGSYCRTCGAELLPDAAFCASCGTPLLPADRKTPQKQRRSLLLIILSAAALLLALLGFTVFKLFDGVSLPSAKSEAEVPVLSPADAAKSVLYLECYDSTGDFLGTGSGFLINDGRTLVTNHHVIENVHSITVSDSNGEYAADVLRVLHFNEQKDLAVLELNRDTELPPLPLGDSEPLTQGDRIYAIGYPLGMSNTVSDGIISSMYTEDHVELLQITAPISPGSSGGALLDQSGSVVGIVVARYVNGQNMNLAVAVNELENLLTYQSDPVGLDTLYLESHPQLTYGSYEVGLKSILFSDNDFAEDIYDLWLMLTPDEASFSWLVHEYQSYEGFTYRNQTEYVSPGMYGKEFDAWCFDVDRNFGDVYWASEGDGSALYFFYEVQKVKTDLPAQEDPEETSLAEEPPAEETPMEEPPMEVPEEEAPGCTHIWSMIAVRQTPDCTQDGSATVHCILCRAWEQRTLTALGHSYENGSCTFCGAQAPVYMPPVQPETPQEEQRAPADAEHEPSTEEGQEAEVPSLTKDMLQGKWSCSSIDGIYGRSQDYVFNGSQFYWTFWKGGINEGGSDAVEAKSSGTYTIDGNTIYFSNGVVGTYAGGCLYIDGLTFYKR